MELDGLGRAKPRSPRLVILTPTAGMYVCIYVCMYVCTHISKPSPQHRLDSFSSQTNNMPTYIHTCIELAFQVSQVARSLTRHMPLRVSCLTGGKSQRTQKDMLNQGVDVLIGTPGRIQYFLEENMVGRYGR